MPFLETHSGIDLGSPVIMDHYLNRDKQFWGLCLPGLMGGAKLQNIIGNRDLNIGKHGTLTSFGDPNIPSGTSGWRPSNHPSGFGCLLLNGTSTYVALPNGILFKPPAANLQATLFASFKSTAASGSDGRLLLFTVDGGNSTCAILLFRSTTTVTGFARDSGGGLIQVNSSVSGLNDGTWHRMVWSVAPPNATLYVDGVASGSNATVSAANTFDWGAFPAWIGSFGAGNFVGGYVNNIGLSHRAWSALEVSADYELEKRSYPGMLRRVGSATWFLGKTGNRRRRVLIGA